MKPKSIFKSRSAALGFLTALAGVVSYFSESTAAWISSNAPLLLMLIGTASVWLRRITHGRVAFRPEPEDFWDWDSRGGP